MLSDLHYCQHQRKYLPINHSRYTALPAKLSFRKMLYKADGMIISRSFSTANLLKTLFLLLKPPSLHHFIPTVSCGFPTKTITSSLPPIQASAALPWPDPGPSVACCPSPKRSAAPPCRRRCRRCLRRSAARRPPAPVAPAGGAPSSVASRPSSARRGAPGEGATSKRSMAQRCPKLMRRPSCCIQDGQDGQDGRLPEK